MFTTLKIFVDLVEARSFSRAASLNYLTPSAVSQRIHALEEELGQELVFRNRGGLVPTEAGRVFYAAVREVMQRYERALAEMSGLKGCTAGRLQIGTVTSVGLHEIPRYIKRYLKKCPDVELRLEYMGNRDIYAGVQDMTLELGVVAYPARQPQFRSIVFEKSEMVVIAPLECRLAVRRRIGLPQLEGHRFVAFDEGLPTGRMVMKRLRQAGIGVDVVHRFDNIETLKRAVEVGAGISIVPRSTVEQEVQCGTLKAIALEGEAWERPVAVVCLRSRNLSPAAQAFVRVLRESPEQWLLEPVEEKAPVC